MAVLIGALLTILVVAVILYPFIKGRFRSRTTPTLHPSAEVGRSTRDEIYDDIRTLRLEYELGSVDEEEYKERLQTYRSQAALAMRDQEQSESELDRSLEEEIQRARALLESGDRTGSCPSCGRPLSQEDAACPDCGTAQPEGFTLGQGEGGSDEGPLP